MRELTTFNEECKALTVEFEGIVMPADSTFKTVNDYVNGMDVTFEELQALCLGLASELDKLKTMTVIN